MTATMAIRMLSKYQHVLVAKVKSSGQAKQQQEKTHEDGPVQMREEYSLFVLVGGKIVAGG
jgi:hypothetical protein